MDVLNRRQFLKATGAAAAGTAFLGLTTPSWAHPAQRLAFPSEYGVSVSPFPLAQVSLLAGPFLDNMNRTLSYLSFIDADRMLYNFRANVALSTQGAAAIGGWESHSKELRGHSIAIYSNGE